MKTRVEPWRQEWQRELLSSERDAALELLQAALRIQHTLALGFWPKDKRLAEFEAAIHEARRIIGVKNEMPAVTVSAP